MAEVYKLSWTPGAGATQEVRAIVNGALLTIEMDLPLSVDNVEGTFQTDAAVEWWIITYDADKTRNLVSIHNIFTAVSGEPLVAATNLSAVWLRDVI